MDLNSTKSFLKMAKFNCTANWWTYNREVRSSNLCNNSSYSYRLLWEIEFCDYNTIIIIIIIIINANCTRWIFVCRVNYTFDNSNIYIWFICSTRSIIICYGLLNNDGCLTSIEMKCKLTRISSGIWQNEF